MLIEKMFCLFENFNQCVWVYRVRLLCLYCIRSVPSDVKVLSKKYKTTKNNNLHPFIFSKIQKSSLYGLWSLRSSFKKLLFSLYLFSKTVQNRKNFNVCVFFTRVLSKFWNSTQNLCKTKKSLFKFNRQLLMFVSMFVLWENSSKPSTKIVKLKISKKIQCSMF